MPLLEYLQQLKLSTDLPQSDIDYICSSLKIIELQANKTIFTEGEETQGFYFVLEGFVKLIRITSDGRELVLFVVRSGYSLGEGAIFQNNTQPLTAITMEKTKLLFFPKKVCFELVRKSPDFALSMLSLFAVRQRMLVHKLAAQGERNATKRVAGYILHRYFLEGVQGSVPFNLSREDLASLLGLARETLSRQLSLLVECGAIILEGRKIFIKDLEILKIKAEKE